MRVPQVTRKSSRESSLLIRSTRTTDADWPGGLQGAAASEGPSATAGCPRSGEQAPGPARHAGVQPTRDPTDRTHSRSWHLRQRHRDRRAQTHMGGADAPTTWTRQDGYLWVFPAASHPTASSAACMPPSTALASKPSSPSDTCSRPRDCPGGRERQEASRLLSRPLSQNIALGSENDKRPRDCSRGPCLKICPATTYSPTGLPLQYHRR